MLTTRVHEVRAYESQNSDYQHLQDNIFGKQSKNKCDQIVTNFKKMYGRRAGRVALCQKSNSPHIEFRLFLDELREAHI